MSRYCWCAPRGVCRHRKPVGDNSFWGDVINLLSWRRLRRPTKRRNMKASELIADLKALIQENGDLDVLDDHDEPIMIIANEDTEGNPAFLVT